ncbi:hypothetical protein HMPREF2969_06735 [Lactobacillus sp. HMSC056D05]|nr:hypothetical protein HMPREF2969_06735 [Lactobacillus sp. HMSC056D05]
MLDATCTQASRLIIRLPVQKPARKDLKCNGQKEAITPEADLFWLTPITRSPAQKSACKDLKRNGQTRAITFKAAYTPTSKRAGSRSLLRNLRKATQT